MAKQSTYINRELSWVKFNERVLGEALRKSNPLLERLKFMAIVSSNFDEFFMVRVARLMRDKLSGDHVGCPSGKRPSQVLRKLLKDMHSIVDQQYERLTGKVIPKLAAAGYEIITPDDYTAAQDAHVRHIFEQEIFPTLTPRAVKDDDKLDTMLANLRLHVAFRVREKGKDGDPLKLAIVEIPSNLDRFHMLEGDPSKRIVALLEDIIVHCADMLFPGHIIHESAVFRVTRDADMSVDEERDEDFIQAMAEVLVSREQSFPVRLEVDCSKYDLCELLRKRLDLPTDNVFYLSGPLDLKAFMKLCFLPGFDEHKIDVWPPQQPQSIPHDADMWELLKQRDVLLHHPYESFKPVVQLVEQAAHDPDVLSIKMTLYRTSGHSPIVRALAHAAEEGKQVAALVELKARFDEEQNIEWAKQLERAGVIVIYGVAHLKVHSKALMIVRKEVNGIMRYVHLGTGNYNDSTAKLYTDMGLLTTREDLTFETALFFNAITGYSAVPSLQKLIMAPHSMRTRVSQMIEREMERAANGAEARIMAKMNSLVDPDIIKLLYKASKAGVTIDLNVRGICCLRPGVKGLSENIRVVSVIDRYLEHTRAFYFHNGGQPEFFLSSADWMTRNINRRVELMFPIEDAGIKRRLYSALSYYFTDNSNAHELQSDGEWKAVTAKPDERVRRSQEHFYRQACLEATNMMEAQKRSFDVRRKPPKK